VHFVGVDLAWGQNKPTGVAVLDRDGLLLHVSTAQTDEEIVAALTPYVAGDCLVAIDAPLIVKNPTGNRPAEAALNRDFARWGYSADRTNPAQGASQGRGAGGPSGVRRTPRSRAVPTSGARWSHARSMRQTQGSVRSAE
jgi:predicted RNase H-like nuclease